MTMTDRDAETLELDLLEDALRKTMLSHSGAELDAALGFGDEPLGMHFVY